MTMNEVRKHCTRIAGLLNNKNLSNDELGQIRQWFDSMARVAQRTLEQQIEKQKELQHAAKH